MAPARNSKSYTYQPLVNDPTQPRINRNLRLIHLKSATLVSDPLACKMDIVNTYDDNKYEAVSWCWGDQAKDHSLRIDEVQSDSTETTSVIMLPETLDRALRTLRYTNKSRALWIDLICINQADLKERSDQVSMMPVIYGKARRVCIWLDEMMYVGEDSGSKRRQKRHSEDDSEDEFSDVEMGNLDLKIEKRKADFYERVAELDKKAITFILEEVLGLWRFDDLCRNKAKAEEWAALLALMRKPWFSRRWVVQEIALARRARIYTSKARIDWRDFVDAVSLFVEVEDATRRLTEIMQQHEVYHHVPDFFEDLSALGASMLVGATSNLFRKDTTSARDSQRSLEYLMSVLPVFDVSDPRDAVYSLLAISKDTHPIPARQSWSLGLFQHVVQEDRKDKPVKKPYRVDYLKDVATVFQEFVSFAIHRALENDPSRALDIICRPWVPTPSPLSSRTSNEHDLVYGKLPSWIMGPQETPFKIYIHPTLGRRMSRYNADPLVGLPEENRIYRAAESRVVDESTLKFMTCGSVHSLFVNGFELDTIGTRMGYSQNGQIPWRWVEAAGWTDIECQPPPAAFWRTLCGDRNQYGRNAPPFFERACHESVRKHQHGGPIDTKKLMTEGRCSIVAAYLRRVRAVIWNRQLARTSRLQKLCLLPSMAQDGDKICILYGCSVPVILRPHTKSDEMMEAQARYDAKASNKPREDAARKIVTMLRKRQMKQRNQHSDQGRGQQGLPPDGGRRQVNAGDARWMTHETTAQRNARWEERRQEEEDIRQSEDLLLDAEIAEARRLPQSDQRRQFFEFIGPCYVHDMMNGEAIEEKSVSHIANTVFELQ